MALRHNRQEPQEVQQRRQGPQEILIFRSDSF